MTVTRGALIQRLRQRIRHHRQHRLSLDDALSIPVPAHMSSSYPLWRESDEAVRYLYQKYGAPVRQELGSTRRVLIYEPDFVVKIPLNEEGVMAINSEYRHFTEQNPQMPVRLPRCSIIDIPASEDPVLQMEWVEPMDSPWAEGIATLVDRGQIGIHPVTGEVLAFDL